MFRRWRGRSLARGIKEATPILRDWINYFRLAETKGVFESLEVRR
jgi:RNA-directed DNA polymerase